MGRKRDNIDGIWLEPHFQAFTGGGGLNGYRTPWEREAGILGLPLPWSQLCDFSGYGALWWSACKGEEGREPDLWDFILC